MKNYWPKSLFGKSLSKQGQSLFLDLFPHFDGSIEEALSVLDRGQSLGVLFDPDFCREQLNNAGFTNIGDSASSVAREWIINGAGENISPSPAFDPNYYKNFVLESENYEGPIIGHYLSIGRAKGLPPSKTWEPIFECFAPPLISDAPDFFSRFIELLPVAFFHETDLRKYEILIHNLVSPKLAAKRAVDKTHLTPDRYKLFWRYVAGLLGSTPISPLFNEQVYRENWKTFIDNSENGGLEDIEEAHSPLLHWMSIGRFHNVSPTHIFNSEYYYEAHQVARDWNGPLIDHFIIHGSRSRLNPSNYFHSTWYAQRYQIPNDYTPLNHYCEVGEELNYAPAPGVDVSKFNRPEGNVPTKLDLIAGRTELKLQRLKSNPLSSLIDKAAAIDPRVRQISGYRRTQFPPFLHDKVDQATANKSLRKSVSMNSADNIIFQQRTGNIDLDRIAKSICVVFENTEESCIIIDTDERSISANKPKITSAVFSLADIASSQPSVLTLDSLLNLIRGLSPKRIFNLNSELIRKTVSLYGRQLSEEMEIYSLLSSNIVRCSEQSNFFEETYDYTHSFMVNNRETQNWITSNYKLTSIASPKLHVLAPVLVDPPHSKFTRQFNITATERAPLRALWLGDLRLDGSVEYLMAVAKLEPSLEIWIYSNNEFEYSENSVVADLPSNVRLAGAFSNVDDLPLDRADCLLVTNNHDAPVYTVLDLAASGFPIVGHVSIPESQRRDYQLGSHQAPPSPVEAIDAIERIRKEVQTVATDCERITKEVSDKFSLDRQLPEIEALCGLIPGGAS